MHTPFRHNPRPATLRFGPVQLPPALEAFRQTLNREMTALLQSLPASTHADAAIFFMQHLGTAFIPTFDYFRHYHAPAWSVLYWLAARDGAHRLCAEEALQARRAHAMALFLHPLDDHLNDGQLPATHLHLLLRSQAWRRMHTALAPLAAAVDGGDTIVQRFIDDYYASIATPPARTSLEGYCTHFRKQMATWLIVPVLMARRQALDEDLAAGLQRAYESFGIAWRLLDDLQDIAPDRRNGTRSAVYYGLPAELQPAWPRSTSPAGCRDRVADYLAVHAVADLIAARIGRELTSAAALADDLEMPGLAAELRALGRPFPKGDAPS
jgi:hypothetical protein